jgi:O-antigen ligase
MDMPKATGLLSNYGDLAIVSSITLLSTFIATNFINKTNAQIYNILVFTIVIIGYLGAQSRSMALSLIVSLCVYWFVLRVQIKASSTSFLGVFFLTMSIGVVSTLIFLFGNDVIDSLTSWGGKQATITASDRLHQYAYALDILRTSPFFGDGKQIIDSGILIHNVWLNTMAQGGIVSGFALLLLFVVGFYGVIKKQTDIIRKKISAISAGIISSVFIAGEFYGGFTYLFLFSLGFGVVSTTILKINNDDLTELS